MIAFLAEWFFIIFGCFALGLSFYWNDSKVFGRSSFFFFVSVGLFGYYSWSSIQPFIMSRGLIPTVTYLTVGYILAGVATAFIYWLFYLWKAKERFDEFMTNTNLSSKYSGITDQAFLDALKKYTVLKDHLKEIFDDPENELKLQVHYINDGYLNDKLIATPEELSAAVAEVLPPRFKKCKPFIVGAGIVWPVTLVWLLISRVVKQLIERIVSTFGRAFDGMSRAAFGKF